MRELLVSIPGPMQWQGEWWFSNDERNRYQGTLRYEGLGKATVRLNIPAELPAEDFEKLNSRFFEGQALVGIAEDGPISLLCIHYVLPRDDSNGRCLEVKGNDVVIGGLITSLDEAVIQSATLAISGNEAFLAENSDRPSVTFTPKIKRFENFQWVEKGKDLPAWTCSISQSTVTTLAIGNPVRTHAFTVDFQEQGSLDDVRDFIWFHHRLMALGADRALRELATGLTMVRDGKRYEALYLHDFPWQGRRADSGDPGKESFFRGENCSYAELVVRWNDLQQALEPAVTMMLGLYFDQFPSKMAKIRFTAITVEALHQVLCTSENEGAADGSSKELNIDLPYRQRLNEMFMRAASIIGSDLLPDFDTWADIMLEIRHPQEKDAEDLDSMMPIYGLGASVAHIVLLANILAALGVSGAEIARHLKEQLYCEWMLDTMDFLASLK